MWILSISLQFALMQNSKKKNLKMLVIMDEEETVMVVQIYQVHIPPHHLPLSDGFDIGFFPINNIVVDYYL